MLATLIYRLIIWLNLQEDWKIYFRCQCGAGQTRMKATDGYRTSEDKSMPLYVCWSCGTQNKNHVTRWVGREIYFPFLLSKWEWIPYENLSDFLKKEAEERRFPVTK